MLVFVVVVYVLCVMLNNLWLKNDYYLITSRMLCDFVRIVWILSTNWAK